MYDIGASPGLFIRASLGCSLPISWTSVAQKMPDINKRQPARTERLLGSDYFVGKGEHAKLLIVRAGQILATNNGQPGVRPIWRSRDAPL